MKLNDSSIAPEKRPTSTPQSVASIYKKAAQDFDANAHAA